MENGMQCFKKRNNRFKNYKINPAEKKTFPFRRDVFCLVKQCRYTVKFQISSDEIKSENLVAAFLTDTRRSVT